MADQAGVRVQHFLGHASERMKAADEAGFKTDVEGKSVTALEVEFGVLADPEQRPLDRVLKCREILRRMRAAGMHLDAQDVAVLEKLEGME